MAHLVMRGMASATSGAVQRGSLLHAQWLYAQPCSMILYYAVCSIQLYHAAHAVSRVLSACSVPWHTLSSRVSCHAMTSTSAA